MGLPIRTLIRALQSGGPIAVPAPAGFGAVPFGATISRVGSTFSTNWSPVCPIAEGEPGVSTYYVDKATGSDSNPGTQAQPFRTPYKAVLIGRGTAPKMLIKVKGGVYGVSENFNNKNPEATTLAVVSWDGLPVVFSNETPLTAGSWTAAGSAYYASVAGQGFAEYGSTVWDGKSPRPDGDYVPLSPVGSIAACQATPGTYFVDTAAVRVYVRTSDSRAPDADLHVFQSWSAPGQYMDYPAAPADAVCYFERVHFYGGAAAFNLQQTSSTRQTTAIFKDCVFGYSGQGNGTLKVLGNVIVGLSNCVATSSHGDVLSYQNYGSSPAPVVFENGCIARRAGVLLTGSAANQCSTMHNGGRVLRLNGVYGNAESDQIADVNAGTVSWNIACSAGPGASPNFAGFRAGNGTGAPQMWLDTCSASGNTFSIRADPGASVFVRNFTGAAGNTGTGSISSY